LSAKYYQLRGEVYINLGQYDDAISMYEHAVNLKRDFSPYLSQLGWLYWLQGDLDQAVCYFQQAVEIDPVETWRSGLHSDLALAYIAQGHSAEAIPLLKKSIELDPNVKDTSNTVWVSLETMDGIFDLVVDPVYSLPVNSSAEKGPLQERILEHLGKTDYTTRLFSYDPNFKASDSSLSLNLVLDAIDADYIAAQNINKRESPRLLATIAEAARSAGLYDRAEQSYLLYQLNFPESEYGFRELGILYRGQGRFPEAQEMLEHALKLKPTDKNSWLALGELYKDREMFSEAISALDKAYHLSPIDSYTSELQALIHRQQGNLSQAANDIKHSLVIAESISNRLILADLYRKLNSPNQAVEQCILATDALRRTWPRPLDPLLVALADCLAQSNLTYEELTHLQICKSGNREICYILIGHIQQARGEYDQALSSYNKAAVNQPEDGNPHYFLGQTYQKMGQLSKTEDEYYQAFKLNPQESLPLLTLAQLQWEQGRQEVAIETLHSAVNATPGWGQARTALGNALLLSGDLQGAAVNYRLAQVQSGDTSEGVIFDFSAHLADAEIQSPAPNYVRNDYFTISSQIKSNQNLQQRVLFMHPDSKVSYSVALPEDTNLYFDLALAPDSWRQPGDGVTFSVDIQSEHGTNQVFLEYLDPKNNSEDQRWNSHMIDLSDYAGQIINIIFKADCGPADDCRYDWAGWGEPKLMQP
jgi:tetratricopeptide (TPR) repeat protein